jgi:hypothetical protein
MMIFIPWFLRENENFYSWFLTWYINYFLVDFSHLWLQTLYYWSGPERSPGHELPGVSAEEALAERSLPAHQVHDGSSPEALLENTACYMHSLLIAWNTEINSLTICIVICRIYVNASDSILFTGFYLSLTLCTVFHLPELRDFR